MTKSIKVCEKVIKFSLLNLMGEGALLKFDGGLDSIHGGSTGGLNRIFKISVKSLKNTCGGVHLLILLAISLQDCNFTKNELLYTYFSGILPRFKLLVIVF